ncbi:hypothetical protein L917_14847 [Phytophthora nicotianae]|uniref:Uncharacterized protein n=1 Tax=Phytophthora nicotianae TaxID=4792 RepID=W2MT53_PHYNI|nr:hypothetical protein L917_14847 [Phytophthora nicotianae]ETM38808.1 hypothetical protein L914_14981 [Phytophthora nicotianae]
MPSGVASSKKGRRSLRGDAIPRADSHSNQYRPC